MKKKCWFWLLIVCMTTAATYAARATEDDFEPRPARQVHQNDFMADVVNFDRQVFMGSGSAESSRARMNAYLKLKLDEINRTCDLTESQLAKLKLAARGDIKRYFDQVDAARNKFSSLQNTPGGFEAIWPEITLLQQKQQQGIFDQGSLLEKTLNQTLTENQRSRYQQVIGERHRFRYEAAIDVALTQVEAQVILRREQHEALVKMLLDETRPPLKYGRHDVQYVKYALSRLPGARLKALLDDQQWRQLQPRLVEGRTLAVILANEGIIDAAGAATGAFQGLADRLGTLLEEVVSTAVPQESPEKPESRTENPDLSDPPPANALKPAQP